MWAYVTSLPNIFHGIEGKSFKSGTIEINILNYHLQLSRSRCSCLVIPQNEFKVS